jgi:hypothetical protein
MPFLRLIEAGPANQETWTGRGVFERDDRAGQLIAS